MKSKKVPLFTIARGLIGVLAAFVFLLTLSPALAQRDDPENIPPPDTVTIAGTLQPELGCPGEWNTQCEESMLEYDADSDLWLATFDLPAGSYEYKAALNGAWDDNYGLNAEYYGENIPLEVAEDGPVTFWYDHKSRWVSDSVNSLLAAVVGDFQSVLGCPQDWTNDCYRALLSDPDGDGQYSFSTADIPPGDYTARVAYDPAQLDITLDLLDSPFTVAEGMATRFDLNLDEGVFEIAEADPATLTAGAATEAAMPPPVVATPPDLVVVPGTIQSVLGCDGDWQPDCEATALTYDDVTQLWQATFALPAGDYEYKAALNGTWDVNFGLNAQPGGDNIPLSLAEDADVTFLFSTQTGWITDDVNTPLATVAGSFQDELGCPAEWSPDCLRTWLQDPDGDGTFTFQTDAIPTGAYEAKVAVGLSWDENYGEAGAPGGANIPITVPADGTLVTFVWNSSNKIMTIQVGGSGPVGNLAEARAHWVAEDLIVWDVAYSEDNTYTFHYTETGEPLVLEQDGVTGNAITLNYEPAGLPEELAARFPHLAGYPVFRLPARAGIIRVALKGQVAVAASGPDELLDATSLQIAGVLDDLYAYDGPLGVSYEDGAPVLRVWAPTAQRVRAVLFDDANPETRGDEEPMRVDPETGVWTLVGEPDWDRKFYLYEVRVFAPSTGAVETNLVTDPYSVSLSLNSGRSQIVNLDDPDLKPEGWGEEELPPLDAPEDIVIYELHIRDFSAFDPTVPAELRGTYGAFASGQGAEHLAALAGAGVTHLHLLPSFDIATINEDAAARVEPNPAELSALPPDSEEQQAIIAEIRDQDGFNWGYDPLHFGVPEGSYSTNPNGVQRILVGLQPFGTGFAATIQILGPFLADRGKQGLQLLFLCSRQAYRRDAGLAHLVQIRLGVLVHQRADTARRRITGFQHRLLDVLGQLLPARLADRVGEHGAAEVFAHRHGLAYRVKVVGHRGAIGQHRAIQRPARQRFIDLGRGHADGHRLQLAHGDVHRRTERTHLLSLHVLDGRDLLLHQQLVGHADQREQDANAIGRILFLRDDAVSRRLPVRQRAFARGGKVPRQLRYRRQWHLVRDIRGHHRTDVGDAGQRQRQQILGLAQLFGGIVLEDHLAVGRLADRIHEILGARLGEIMPRSRKRIGHTQHDFGFL